MKRLVKLFMLAFALVSFYNVFAAGLEIIDSDEVGADTYIIGTHMFTEQRLYLSTQDIMWASRTIEGDSKDDMVIYYKDLNGNWVDGLTGIEITVPSSFEIEEIDSVLVNKILYGDVNEDEIINVDDIRYITDYIAGYTMPHDFVEENADVNGDGKINIADSELLNKYINGFYPNANLPEQSLGTTYIVRYFIDENKLDIYSVDYVLEGEILIKPQNPNLDGYSFVNWHLNDSMFDDFGETINRNLDLIALWNPNISIPEAPLLSTPIGDYNFIYFDIKFNGVYSDSEKWADIDGVEIYEIVDEELIIIDTSGEPVMITVEPGETRKFVARVYIYDNFNNIIYSEFSNEVVKEYYNESPTLSALKRGNNEWLLTITHEGAYDNFNNYFLSGYELYEKVGNSLVLIDSSERVFEKIVTIIPGERKVFVARIYTYDKLHNKLHSEFSDEVIIDSVI